MSALGSPPSANTDAPTGHVRLSKWPCALRALTKCSGGVDKVFRFLIGNSSMIGGTVYKPTNRRVSRTILL
jgi:hypothetical protein